MVDIQLIVEIKSCVLIPYRLVSDPNRPGRTLKKQLAIGS